jgi:formamidopyrimidine-DNA glycosylase
VLRLHDPRRFGAVVWAPDVQAPMARKLLDGLGPEPLTDDFDPLRFASAVRSRKSSIKQVLLAGDLVVGVGNIYASEALFLAGIRPTCRADTLSRPRALRLHAAIRTVLTRALALGGSTLRDFSSSDGKTGYFQMDAAVYGREGLPCRVCATPVRQIRQGQRSTFFCPCCQPR